MEYILTIGIPTWNREQQLRQLLDDLLHASQYLKDVEVLICDNGSSDQTQQMIISYKDSSLKINSHRNEKNIGFDRNFIKICSLAKGRYLWVLGSDDRINESYLIQIINFLKEGGETPTLITFNYESFVNSAPDVFIRRDIVPNGSTLNGDVLACAKIIRGNMGLLSQCLIRTDALSEALFHRATSNFAEGFAHMFVRWNVMASKGTWFHHAGYPLRYREVDDLAKTLSPLDRVLFDAFAVLKIYNDLGIMNKALAASLTESFLPELLGRLSTALIFSSVRLKRRIEVLCKFYSLLSLRAYLSVAFVLLSPRWLVVFIKSAYKKVFR
jgi:glycosyltransferase involved in cell wall biosynthesis